MPEHGYIKLHRQIQDCWIWDSGKFDKRSAWIDLLMLANHRDKKFMFNGKPVVITRGQFMTSIRKLAVRWEWSTSTVFEFLKILEDDNMIKKESDSHRTLLTIINYDVYQGVSNTDQTLSEHQSNANRTQIETTKEYKNIRNKEFKENDTPNGVSKRKCFTPPTVDEVRAYCEERGNNIDPQRFVDFYESKGWMVGKNKMKNWKAAVRNWENRDKPAPQESKPREWGKQIYDKAEEQHFPRFGFPAEWFQGETLIKERVKAVKHPKNIQIGVYEEYDVSTQELVELYELRRRYYFEQRN
mgnify:CR=1 FL=1